MSSKLVMNSFIISYLLAMKLNLRSVSGSVRVHVFRVLDIIAYCKSNAHHSLELGAEHLGQLLRAGNFITRDTGFGIVEQVRDHVH